jgi:outer membrane protein assembly factor BamB
MCFFGSRDGWVYAVRADSGQLIWRFLAAVNHKRIMHCSQVASVWPVASILIHKGALYANAGRLSAVDKGLQFYKLDPATGRLLWKSRYISREPKHYGPDEEPELGRPYNRYADLLVSDGERVYHNLDLLDESETRDYAVRPRLNVRLDRKNNPAGDPWLRGGFNGLRSRRTQVSARDDPGAMIYRGVGYTKVAFGDDFLFGVPAAKMPKEFAIAGAGDMGVIVRNDHLELGPVTEPSSRGWKGDQIPLPDAQPAENGIAIAYGKIYVTTRSGSIFCYGTPEE